METRQAHPGRSDRKYINLSEDYEVRDWAKHFNISENELKEAVKQAGSSAEEVQAWLDSKNRSRSNS